MKATALKAAIERDEWRERVETMSTEGRRTTEDERWLALQQRDAGAEGTFLYGVRTTGIYCRPTCASRLPRRENVQFFDSPAEAQEAGFRPCKRCTPDAASPQEQQAELIVRACRLLAEAEEPPTLADLAAAVGLSPFHFHRLFKAALGLTPKEYADALRLRRLQEGLAQGTPVTQSIYDAGYGSSSRFYERAADSLGMAPARYRDGAAGIEIHFATVRSSLGWLLVAATDRGVCAIEFGETPDLLHAGLQARFPRAELREGRAAFAGWVARVLALVETPGHPHDPDLPLDIWGTAFQQQVWKALRTIPSGSTRSYAEIAQEIGRPKAVRAVARACASNSLALAVPCHRVVRRDGGLGGYRWGPERKRELLRREAAAARQPEPEQVEQEPTR